MYGLMLAKFKLRLAHDGRDVVISIYFDASHCHGFQNSGLPPFLSAVGTCPGGNERWSGVEQHSRSGSTASGVNHTRTHGHITITHLIQDPIIDVGKALVSTQTWRSHQRASRWHASQHRYGHCEPDHD